MLSLCYFSQQQKLRKKQTLILIINDSLIHYIAHITLISFIHVDASTAKMYISFVFN